MLSVGRVHLELTVPEERSPTSMLGPAVPIENQSVLILPIPSGYKKALLWFNPAAAQHHMAVAQYPPSGMMERTGNKIELLG